MFAPAPAAAPLTAADDRQLKVAQAGDDRIVMFRHNALHRRAIGVGHFVEILVRAEGFAFAGDHDAAGAILSTRIECLLQPSAISRLKLLYRSGRLSLMMVTAPSW